MSGTENKLAELVVGTCGWEHAPWLESYYPEDLPEDWRLNYYANEFGCMVLPAKIWMLVDKETIEQWLEDVDEDFMFFIELPARKEDVTASLSTFAGRCAGAILQHGNPDDWRDVVGDIPVLYSEDTGNLKCYQHAGQAETVLAWLAAGPGEKIELPALREQIEAGLKVATTRLAFIIGNEAPAIGNLQNAKVIAELLGA